MPKKLAGITPEELTKLISRLKGLPIVEPKIITAQKAIADFKNEFRDALGKGYTIEQLVEIWCEHGSEIKPGTFLGYMRDPKQTISIGESGRPSKRKRAPSHNSALHMLEIDDHTTRRQKWMMTPQDVAHDLPDVLVPLVAQFPDSIRTDGEGNLLFAAHDICGSIQSFDRLSLQSMPPIMMQKTSVGGVCAIGAHPSNVCLLVRTHLDAITELLQIDGPMPMVIVVGDAPDLSHMAQIEWLTKRRNLAIATKSFENTPDLMDQLRQTFPHVKFWGAGPPDYVEQVET